MNNVDDILYAPIGKSVKSDFLCRVNPTWNSFDWKPVSDRAHQWTNKYLTRAYSEAQADYDGWILNASHTPGAPAGNLVYWVQELIEGNYIFTEINA